MYKIFWKFVSVNLIITTTIFNYSSNITKALEFKNHLANDNSLHYTQNLKKGIDVSHHNGNINWQAVKNSGIDFAIIRVGYGWKNWDKQTDRKYKENVEGAKSVGLPVGAYFYSYATTPNEANLEANFCINRLKMFKNWEYPIFMDFEDPSQMNLSKTKKTNIILTFLDKLNKSGYYTGYYTFLNWEKNYLDLTKLSKYPLWIAHWAQKCEYTKPYGMWQYTSSAKINGINGNVDMDYCYIDYPNIIKSLKLNGF